MKKIVYAFMIWCLLPSVSFAGDVMPAGTILTKDSYVFSIDEAERLKIRLDELEQQVKKQDELITQYQDLDEVHQQKEQVFDATIKIDEATIEEYERLHKLDTARVDKLEREQKFSSVERAGAFTLGVAVTIGSIMLANSVNNGLRN